MGNLHNAVRRSDLDEVRTLVGRGSNVNAIDKHGYTPLMVASENDNYEICEYLLHHGAAKSIRHATADGDRAVDLTEDEDVLELLNSYMEQEEDEAPGGNRFGPGMPVPDGNID
ncbi:hypothetical protein BJY04DRAFT_188204 [Aspergillus karnatakaensis]|uniref:ankyrin repeat domain-containing protein n=1 Tax=Aspergillus karnatakaensis TaxID=1810916 RepID=UPI003CCD3A50